MYEQIRDTFLNGLNDFYAKDIMPSRISINMRRALTEHKKRLVSKGVSYSERYIDNAEVHGGESRFERPGFITTNSYKHCNAVTEMNDGKTGIKCDDASDDVVYLHVMDRNKADRTVADEELPIICPNCGHHGQSKIFVDGCPMCGTKFAIDDIYPCVNSYYSMPWPMPATDGTEKGIDKARKIGLITGLVLLAVNIFFAFIASLAAVSSGEPFIRSFIVGSMASIFFAALGGWIAFLICTFAGLGVMTAKSVAGLAKMAANTLDMTGAINSKNNAEAAVRPYDPAFSFEIFEGKVLSAVRTVAYSDNRSDCSAYNGNDDLSFMDDLVDIRYRGATKFDKAVVTGDFLHVLVTLYLDNIYYRDGKFFRSRENFSIDLVRRKDVQTPSDFTIYSVNCRSCGGSFDAVLSRKCPFCGASFDLAGLDWTMVRITRIPA